MNTRQLATVLFALRELQNNYDDDYRNAMHFDEVEPLTEDEISELCEELNTPNSKPVLTPETGQAVNSNCLSGLRCPNCHALEPFRLDTIGPNPNQAYNMSQSELQSALNNGKVNIITYSAIWTDMGSVDTCGDTEFDVHGKAICMSCNKVGKFRDFQIKDSSSLEGMLNDHARIHNWSVEDKLNTCLEYIENQQSNDAFRDFLSEQT